MKRNDDNSGIIKIPDVSAVTASAANQQQQQPLQPPVFITRQPPPHIEMASRPSVTSGNPASQISLPRVAHGGGVTSSSTGGVTVYRSEPSHPPAAHSGGVAVTTTPSAASSTQQPPAAHSVINQQPPTTINPEQITLPTTPVSLPYGTAVTTSYSGTGPPIRTLTQQPINVQTHRDHDQIQSNSLHPSVTSNMLQQRAPSNHQQQTFPIRTVSERPESGISPDSTGQLAPTLEKCMREIPTGLSALSNATASIPIGNNSTSSVSAAAGSAQFQRLKVEDALSYLDQVKFKFGNQPQVYNDFLDIMKEFKSQSIDTPGVIARVSCLFKGHPELIVGFNTFLPPGYKIEVQRNDAIAVSMPGVLGAGMQTIVHTPHGIQTMAPQGHLTSITTPQATSSTTVRPVTITAPTVNNAQTPKFQQTTVIKSSGGEYNVPHPLRLGSEVSLVPQNPPSSHLGLGQQHLLTTAANQPTPTSTQQPINQPVEFNHAINYVNKIKNRFADQPDVYKQFLEILHTYQKDQRAIKEGHQPTGRYLTEAEVFSQVAKLFQNQEDLLNEFSQFLPEATNDSLMPSTIKTNDHTSAAKRPTLSGSGSSGLGGRGGSVDYSKFHPVAGPGGRGGAYQGMMPGNKRTQGSGLSQPPPKKPKFGVLRDVTLAEAGKYGTLNEYAFFDKVRKALKSKETYEDFLRCLVLFNQEVISRTELVQLTAPFLNRYPELFKWFKEFVGYKENAAQPANESEQNKNEMISPSASGVNPRFSGDSAMDIDYATCKRLGASYCALPKKFVQPTCSGRTSLCREVLNDTWVSTPSWSEDSQFVTSRKTQYEEFIYRTEDERFEFDVVLETNKDTIKSLECTQKKMSRMPPEEAARYRLDDNLGGSSPTIHQRAIRRIYGEKAADIIEGLKRNPVVAVPLVLRRLKSKDEEWREVQKNFNKTWREQNEKYYLKSLDHQGLLFKQSDTRFLRSKSLLNELETLYDERHEAEEANSNNQNNALEEIEGNNPVPEGPHLTVEYTDSMILDDVNNLLIHHVKRQTAIHKEDKHKIKVLLKHFLMDLFKHPRQDMSDDEREDDDESEKEENNPDDPDASNGSKSTRAERARKKKSETNSNADKNKDSATDGKNNKNNKNGEDKKDVVTEADIKIEPDKSGRRTPLHARDMDPDESYSFIMCNNNWCLFLRLHNILSERLTKMYNQAVIIANEESKDKKDRKESIAVALRLKPKNEIEPEDYYATFLDMVKNLLDGNMDGQAYEDTLREMFGIHAYNSFTLDKVVSNAVRQLQHLVMDEACVDCHELFQTEKKNGATGGYCRTTNDRHIAELLYQKRAEKLLADENCFKLFIYHQSGKMSFELLDTESEAHNSDQDEEGRRKYSSYVERFIQPGEEISEECREHLARKPVFLPRSIRSYNNSPYGKLREAPNENHIKTEENGVSKESSETSPNGKNDKVNDKHDNSIVNQDNLQCKFNPRNFKILYVIDSETCFYRKLALTRAKNSHKAVSRRKCSDFGRWHSKWLKSNVSDTSQTSINEWFMGKCEGLVPNRTHKITKADHESTPFRTYYKYKAEIIKTNNFTEKNGKIATTVQQQQTNNAPAGTGNAVAASLTSATSGTS